VTLLAFPLAAKPSEWTQHVAAMHDAIRSAETVDEIRALWRWLQVAEQDVTTLTTLAGAKLIELEGRTA